MKQHVLIMIDGEAGRTWRTLRKCGRLPQVVLKKVSMDNGSILAFIKEKTHLKPAYVCWPV
jgi:hypothetical protein